MAQLRDAHTSALIYDGTPEECVAIADKIGADEVLYDGVGEHFDPDAVRTAAALNLEHLEGRAKTAEAKRQTDLSAGASKAQAALVQARKRVG